MVYTPYIMARSETTSYHDQVPDTPGLDLIAGEGSLLHLPPNHSLAITVFTVFSLR